MNCLFRYNDALPEGVHAAIPPTGATGGAAFTLLVGNTKHVWEPFLGALRAHPQLLELSHPLDAYMERSVEAVLQDALPGCACLPELPSPVDWSPCQGHARLDCSSISPSLSERCRKKSAFYNVNL